MYEIAVEGHFDAAHFLRQYQGKCEALHGHRFRVVARVSANELNDAGIAYDFTELKKHLKDILGKYDHVCLNEVPPFDEINPSSEHLAKTINDEMKKKLAGENVSISSIEVWESPQSWATYRPD
jgi:6-pyruvoyltetrahydropterin/6-carboxytetrahydropterin synthase